MANVGTGLAGRTLIGRGNTSSPGFADIGTLSGLTQYGLLIAQGAGAFQATSAGSAGAVMRSAGGLSNPDWSTFTLPSSVAQGDVLYGSATNVWSLLNKNTTASRYLSNSGASNNPAWAQVDLTNGVTGTLPVTSGGTGLTAVAAGDLLYGSATNVLSRLATNTDGKRLTLVSGLPAWSTPTYPNSSAQGDLLYSSAANTYANLAKNTTASRYLSNSGTSNNPAWAQIDLTNGVTGVLPIANGGTNANASQIVTSNGLVKFDGTRLVTSTAATLDSSNRYANTAQPACSVYLFNLVTNATGDGTVYTPIYDQIIFNRGTIFNIATSVFTAPVTGIYIFNVSMTVSNLSLTHTEGQCILDFSGSGSDVNTSVLLSPYAIKSSAGYATMNFTFVGQMTAGNTCTPKIYVNGGTKTVTVEGAVGGRKSTYFTAAQIF